MSAGDVVCPNCGQVHHTTVCPAPFTIPSPPPVLMYPPVIQTGWQCPKCGSVYGPWMPSCMKCAGNAPIISDNTCGPTDGEEKP